MHRLAQQSTAKKHGPSRLEVKNLVAADVEQDSKYVCYKSIILTQKSRFNSTFIC